MFFLDHIWIIPLLPAIGATMMFFFGRKLPKSAVNAFCVGAVVLAFAWRYYCRYARTHAKPLQRQD